MSVFIYHKFSILHREHLKGIHAQPVVILGREVKDTGCPDETFDVLDSFADLFLVGTPGLFDSFDENQQRVVSVASEGAHVLFVSAFIILFVFYEEFLLGIIIG